VVVLGFSAEAEVRGQLFPQTTENIHLEMVFNYLEPDPNVEAGVVDVVWGSDYATQPSGVYNSSYIPISVDNFTHSVAWYQKHHPDWLEYQCDRKTLAFEFGSTNLAPLDFTNLEVQAVKLPTGNYSDVNGNPVGSTVAMPAQSGLVLLKQ
jgi:hypothetical protein